jgi:hypothetical protein
LPWPTGIRYAIEASGIITITVINFSPSGKSRFSLKNSQKYGDWNK